MKHSIHLSVDHPVLSNHRVYGQHLLPGLAYIDLLYQFFRRRGHDYPGLELRNLTIYAPLIAPRGGGVQLEIDWQELQPGAWQIVIEGREVVKGGRPGDVRRYATAQMQYAEPAEFADTLSIDEIRRSARETFDTERLYDVCRSGELVHTGPMKAHGTVYASAEALYADLHVPEDSASSTRAEPLFDPTLIDGSGACIGSALAAVRPDDMPGMSLPLFYESFRASVPLRGKCITRVQLASVQRTRELSRMTMEFFDHSGRKIAELRNFTCKLVRDPAAIAAPQAPAVRASRPAEPAPTVQIAQSGAAPGGARSRREEVEYLLRRLIAEQLHLSPNQVDVSAGFYEMGLQSAVLLDLVRAIDAAAGTSLSPTLLFEYTTVGELAAYLAEHHGERFAPASSASGQAPDLTRDSPESHRERIAPSEQVATAAPGPADQQDIAIIGIGGRFPQADSVPQFWRNLTEGRDCITEIPPSRWDWRRLGEVRTASGKSISKWGGFLEDPSCFDALFFRISPREAEVIDPQERIFLETCWEAIEDAGYTPRTLAPLKGPDKRRPVGVFAGVMHKDYVLVGAEAGFAGQFVPMNIGNASIANRVSYFCNFHGPSIAVDTACSSSLTALHLAVESLRRGECAVALAGGVNLSLHYTKYLSYGLAEMHASDGRCRAFGEGGDGYVSGEGSGAVLLKPLARAIADGDQIYAVIKGTSINHVGSVSGFTVPSPVAQADVVTECLNKAGINPRTIGYVEAHGTGTSLGDPIEMDGLARAYRRGTNDVQFCAIGSVKSNVGHAESAAGVFGLIKIALQMKHRTLVPSLHANALNSHIDWKKSPFFVQQRTEEWQPARTTEDGREVVHARRAALSSFGASGSNAHVVLEESPIEVREPRLPASQSVVVPLSARTPERLQAYARRLLEFVRNDAVDLHDLAFTLQVGREPMDSRVAFVVSSLADLRERLQAVIEQAPLARGTFVGQKQDRNALDLFAGDEDSRELIDKWMARGRVEKLAELWVKGFAVDWTGVARAQSVRRISLPTYPFARDRYWIPRVAGEPRRGAAAGDGVRYLHPLVHTNTSDFVEQRFSTQFGGEEFYLRDHQIGGERVLPAAAYLEMVRAALATASGSAGSAAVELRDTVWQRPLVVSADGARLHVGLYPQDSGDIEYEVYAERDSAEEQRVVYAQGRARVRELEEAPKAVVRDIAELQQQCAAGVLSGAQCYEKFSAGGLQYGTGHRVLHEVRAGRDAQGRPLVVAQLNLPQELASTHGQYVLHPALLDGALQACIGITLLQKSGSSVGSDAGAAEAWVPYALEWLECHGPCPAQAMVIVREVSEVGAPVRKFDIEMCDASGAVKVALKGFSSRPLARPAAASTPQSQLLRRQWQVQELQNHAAVRYSQHHVLLCEVGDAPADAPAVQWEVLNSAADSVAARYVQYAHALLHKLQQILHSKPTGPVRVQVVVPSSGEGARYAGLVAALKTAQLENPNLHGQLIAVDSGETPDSLWQKVQQNAADEAVEVRYEKGQRRVAYIKEYTPESTAGAGKPENTVFKSGGVYLISGGAGGLGQVFAREIFRQAPDARVILTGRRQLSSEQLLPELQQLAIAGGGSLQYQALDVTDAAEVRHLIRDLVSEHRRVDGVIHSAGVLRDSFLIRKSATEVDEVLAPKVYGADNLDEATADQKLDFFVLFSSLAGVYGNVGQADYALANAYLDEYARYRKELVKRGERQGRTVSINWPLWDEGGMQMPEAVRAQMYAAGYVPLKQAQGVSAFAQALSGEAEQVLVLSVRAERLSALTQGRAMRSPVAGMAQRATTAQQLPNAEAPSSSADQAPERLKLERTLQYLKKVLGSTLKLPVSQIDGNASLEQYGIDSLMVLQLTKELEQQFGPLSKTLFFEYQTLEALAQYFLTHHAARLSGVLQISSSPESGVTRQSASIPASPEAAPAASRRQTRRRQLASGAEGVARSAAPAEASRDIAIIGLSGRYPQARTLEEFWKNLQEGRDCITEIPVERWDHAKYFDSRKGTPGKVYSKWGGFMDGVDEFDPLFFNISPREAQVLDPQERLFLQCVYATLEDAGYTREALGRCCASGLPGNVGVFVGVMYEEYQLFGAQAQALGQAVALSGSPSSIANRVSYFCNLHGPSIAVDTMCSSSLTAIHLACESLRHEGCELAIAGGVNVSIHPNKYLLLSQGQFAASSGRCESFGKGGDGYVPGEGVGAVLLKPLAKAIEDGDHIYGVIKASALNHGGKTNGYTVPNPQAQAQLIARVLADSKVPARALSYIEAHGTGTSLGDPIEIAGLTKAFSQFTDERQFCAIGSVKSNIGHCESAAGIAGLTKVLLQMKHGQVVPSLHTETLNPHIDFESTPFMVQRQLSDWNRPVLSEGEGGTTEYPRTAGLSSFGAGGSNAYLLIQEHIPEEAPREVDATVPALIVLSAQSEEQLQCQVQQLHDAIAQGSVNDTELTEVAYTLQVGREAMEHRLGLKVRSLQDLKEKLAAVLQGDGSIDECYRGEVKRNKEALAVFGSNEELKEAIDKWIGRGKYTTLLDLWVKGLAFDWQRLYAGKKPRRISLPTYPFARQSYWIARQPRSVSRTPAARLHPLLHTNISDLTGTRFAASFSGEEFFLNDSVVRGRKTLPAAAYLEMAHAAMVQACGLGREQAGESAVVELREVFWLQPLVVGPNGAQVEVEIAQEGAAERELYFEIYSAATNDAEESAVCCRGRASLNTTAAEALLDVQQIRDRCGRQGLSGQQCYEIFDAIGVRYGAGYQGLQQLFSGESEVLAKLHLPEMVKESATQFVLHPSVLESALQASAVLVADPQQGRSDQAGPEGASMLFAMDAVEVLGRCSGPSWAWVRFSKSGSTTVRKVDVDLCDESGRVCARLRGVSWRAWEDNKGPEGPGRAEPREVQAGDRWLQGGVRELLKEQLHEVLQLEVASIDAEAPLTDYGLNSITGSQLVQLLNRALGTQLQVTLLYDHSSVNALATHLCSEHGERISAALLARGVETNTVSQEPAVVRPRAPRALLATPAPNPARAPAPQRDEIRPSPAEGRTPIAIIGVSGRFPGARSVEELWANLASSRDCISEVPAQRWSLDGFYHPDADQAGALGKSYCKWGGFLDGADESDPAFFPARDDMIGPGTRQLLEVIWSLLESAGYTRESLAREHPGTVGVYLGMMPDSYGTAGAISSSISTLFNCRGPCVTVETMSASSMTALHVASDALACGDCEVAIVAGMCLLTPDKFLLGSRAKVLGRQERSRPFTNGDGAILSECVGAVLLKRLPDAVESGDAIRAVIKTSWLTHRGSSEFSRDAFARTLVEKLHHASVDARSISYVESAATGDANIEQFELAMLTRAFQELTDEEGFCRYATVKSNIGHGEAASAISQVIKVVLQLEHRQLAPLVNQQWISPELKMEHSPFVLQRELEDWQRPSLVNRRGEAEECPRRALVLSFGAGGQGGVLVLDEHIPDRNAPESRDRGDREELIVLSAKNAERLRVASAYLLDFVRNRPDIPLASIAYTLQVGREAMPARLAVAARTHAGLERGLASFLEADPASPMAGPVVWFTPGEPETNQPALRRARPLDLERQLVESHLADGDVQELAALWIGGARIPWEGLHDRSRVRRISLPTYPFARVSSAGQSGAPAQDRAAAAPKNKELEVA